MIAKLLHETFRKLSWIYKRDLVRLLNQSEGLTLDIGGDNLMKEYITNSSINYVSLNYSYGDENDQRYQCDIIANAMDMPEVKTDFYDNVWCFQVLEHVDEPLDLLKESYRILKPGGRVIFSVPQTNILHEAPHHFYNFTKYGLKDLFEKAGFEEIEIKPKGGFWLSMANRFFDYIMIWIHSIRLADLGFGYSIFNGKNIFEKFLAFCSVLPAIFLFILNLLLAFLLKSSDLHEDASIHYVFAKKS